MFGFINGFFKSIGGSVASTGGMSPIGLIFLCMKWTKIFGSGNSKNTSKPKAASAPKNESFISAFCAGGLIGVCRHGYLKWK